MGNRFDDVDNSLSTLSEELSTNTNSIISSIGTKASEIQTSLSKIEENLSTVMTNVESNLSGVASTVESNLAGLIEAKHSSLTEDITAISTKIGTKDDTKTEETLFGKTALLLEKVQNVGNMVYKVYTGTVSANDKLDEVLVNTNINALDDTATAYITSKFNEYRNAPSGDKSYIIEELVTWLKDNGYAK